MFDETLSIDAAHAGCDVLPVRFNPGCSVQFSSDPVAAESLDAPIGARDCRIPHLVALPKTDFGSGQF